jgi:hypothetical protein
VKPKNFGPDRILLPPTPRASHLLAACVNLDYRWRLKARVSEAIFSAFCQCFHPNQLVSANSPSWPLENLTGTGVKWSDVRDDVKNTLLGVIRIYADKLDLRNLLPG